ncbi:protein mesh-like [Ostrea edulis]|uniref:protein mesh-like n=1 Tax=Ostrea edulis TaxID=37623 RepID=UPI0024AF8DCD|nr:protein mesh-like [Ostrea edulis]
MRTFVVFLVISKLSGSYGFVEFYPYGLPVDDKSVEKNDDGSSPEIPISTLFPFFNHQHGHLIVNTNGVISFLKTVSTFTPDPFPLDGDRRLVAIFWADVDTNNGGTVWYRESTNQTILNRATEEVRTYFPQFFRFQATWVFIATWDNVAFYGCSPCTKRNTFQEILITNGQHSFTVFNYKQVEWTTGTASGGDSETGLGGTPAQVGFNAGDGKVYFAVNASRTGEIVKINHMSNIGIPGKFAFRIDDQEIGKGGCNTEGTLTISPRYGPMLGGQYLVIGGPCINPDDVIQIAFLPMTTLFPCQRRSNYSVICITPIFNITGDVTVNVTIKDNNGNVQHHTGLYTIVNPATFKNPVRRHQPHTWINGEQYSISWDQHAFELKDSDTIHIHLFTMKEYAYNHLVWEKSVIQSNIRKTLGTDAIHLQTEGYMAAIRVTAELETEFELLERGIWSDIFAVVPMQQKSKQFCFSWIRQEVRLPEVSSRDTPPCPCTLQQALMDTARYQPDPDCNVVTKTSDDEFNCQYRNDAQHCVRLSIPGPLDSDNVCCYDKNANLIDSRVKEGGTLQRYHYLGGMGNVPYVTNFYYDILPFLHCCRYFGTSIDNGQRGIATYSECQDYLKFRNVSSCYNYIPPRPAGANGDPHIKTLDGLGYNFNGLGEFFFMLSKNASFESQMRFEQAKNSDGIAVQASVCTSFVARVTNTTDTVEVRLNSIRMADVLINGQIQDLSEVSWLRYNGVSVIHFPTTSGNSTGREIFVMFVNLGISFRMLINDDVINVMPVIGNESLKGMVSGLLGNYDGNPSNDLILPNGTVLEPDALEETIFQNYNYAWRISYTNTLFTYPAGKTYADYNSNGHANFRPLFLSSVASSATPEAKELCGNNTDCLFDFHVTRSRKIAQNTLYFFEELEDAEDASVPVKTCPVLQSTQGGVWISNSTQENAVASFACGMDYEEGAHCLRKTCRGGTWSPSQQCECEKITTTMSSSVQITHSTTTTLTDNSALLKSISGAVQMMWLTVGGGVAIIMIVVLVTACVICSKMRSHGKVVRSSRTESSSDSSSGYRGVTGRSAKSPGSFHTEATHVYSYFPEGSNYSLPRYCVDGKRTSGYSEYGHRHIEFPRGNSSRSDLEAPRGDYRRSDLEAPRGDFRRSDLEAPRGGYRRPDILY